MDRAKGDVLSTSSLTDDRITTTAAGGKITAEGADLFLAFVASSDGILYAYDAGSSQTMWSNTEVDSTGTPAVDGAAALIYVGGSDGFIHALNTGSGAEVWRWPTAGEEGVGTITTDITLANGKVYFGVGSELWQLDIASQTGAPCDNLAGGDYLTPVVSGGVIYAANSDGFVYFLNTEPCAWATKSILVQEQLTVKPAVHDGLIYQPGANGVTAYDLEGNHVWGPWPIREGLVQAPRVQGSPAVAGGLVYFGAEDGFIYALDAKTGALMWEWDEGVPIRAAVAVTDGVVYVATSAGEVIAIAPVKAERLGETTPTTGTESDPTTTVPADDGTTTTTVRSGGGGGGTF
jgi:outer membrane protein assembly factor BamB